MGQSDIDDASREIIELRTGWQTALDEIRQSSHFADARRAFEADDQEALASLVLNIFAGHQRVPVPATAHFGVSVAVRRRGPGSSPFLTPEACAEKIERSVRQGLVPAVEAHDWWLADLPPIHLATSLADLDSPFAVRLPGSEITAAVFASDAEFGYRIFTPRLCGDFVVEIATAVDDEWWQALEEPFEEFRTRVQARLASDGVPYALVDI